MLDICVQTIVRNEEDYLYPCIAVVAPHVKRIRIGFDTRSTDGTVDVLKRLLREFPHVEVLPFKVEDPFTDLVVARNKLLGFPEKWGFIVDSDEFHQDIASYTLQNDSGYAFQSWAVWNDKEAHKASCKAIIGRIFKNSPELHWKGRFNNEVLYNDKKPVFSDPVLLPYKYIHFTHVKKDNWRKELKKERIADGRCLIDLPDSIKTAVRDIHKEMSIVPTWRV